MSSQQFIGIIKEEAVRRDARKAESSHQTFPAPESGTSKAKYCVICKRNNHNTSECRNRNKKVCGICGKPNHDEKNCWHRDSDQKGKRKHGGKQPGGDAKRRKADTTNEAKEEEEDDAMQIEEVTFMTEEIHDIPMNPSIEGQQSNISHVTNTKTNDELVTFYDWLADSATTSHICNRKDAFVSYQPLTGKTVAGVGNNQANAEGRGTIELESIYNDYKYLLKLENVLYIPSNRNNLISLGRWDRAGGRYTGGGGAILLTTKDGKHVAKGTKINNNLYKMKVSIRKPGATYSKSTTCTPQTFQASEPTQSWETWHKRYGHIGYTGLQKLHDLNLVDGFTVDMRTPKPDCVTCTEAKQTEEPFNKTSD